MDGDGGVLMVYWAFEFLEPAFHLTVDGMFHNVSFRIERGKIEKKTSERKISHEVLELNTLTRSTPRRSRKLAI